MAAKVNKVEVEIVAVDEASPKIDRLTKKIDGLESDEARIIVTAETERFERQLSGARRLAETLTGDELTVQMRVIGNLESDLEQARALFNQLDGETGTVTLNLSGNAADQIDRVGRSADSSKSVLANMVGNTTQDLGALGGIAGSTGVAIGQMGEYMADAANSGEGLNSVMRNFGKVAIPIAAVTAAMLAFSQGSKQAKERTQELAEAVRELSTATDAEVVQTLQKIFARALLDGEDLDRQLQDLAETNRIGAARMVDVARAAGFEEGAIKLLTDAIERADEATLRGEENAKRYGDTVHTVGAEFEEAGGKVGEFNRFGGEAADNFGIIEDAADDAAESVSSVRGEFEGLLGVLDQRQAIRNAEQALEDVRAAAVEAFVAPAEEAEEKMRDYQEAVDDAIRKLIDAGTDPITINTVLETFDQGKINEALAIAQAKLGEAPPLRLPVALDFRNTNLRIDRDLNVRSLYTPPPPSLNFGNLAPTAPNVVIIQPQGQNPTDTYNALNVFGAVNGDRTAR